MKSRKSLLGENKYYLADTGIYFARNVDGRINYGPVLENIVYTYLASRGYSMSVGQIGALECDFIARKNNGYFYIQVAMTIADANTEEREFGCSTARLLRSLRRVWGMRLTDAGMRPGRTEQRAADCRMI